MYAGLSEPSLLTDVTSTKILCAGYIICIGLLPWAKTADLGPVNRPIQNLFINNITMCL